MPLPSQSARLLGRYGDLLGLLSVFPFISHVKFAGVLESLDAKRKEKKEKEEEEDAKGKGGKKKQAAPAAPDAEDPGYLPPVWALCLILLAELINAWALFDPADKRVQRAVGETLRVQKSSTGAGAEIILRSVERLLSNEDIYFLIRSVAGICGCGSLLISALGGVDRLPGVGAREGPLASARHSFGHLLQNVLRPRVLGVLVLLAATAIGHSSALRIVAKKPGVAELVYALPALLRTIGLTGAAFSPSSDVLPTYAAINVCAAIAREAHVLVYERIKVPDLLAGGLFDVKQKLIGPRSAIALELCAMLVLIPVALRKRRFLLLIPLLALPSLWLAAEAPVPARVEPFVELIIGRIVFCSAVMSMLLVFLGGFPTMTIVIVLAQVLTRIHKLDTIKF